MTTTCYSGKTSLEVHHEYLNNAVTMNRDLYNRYVKYNNNYLIYVTATIQIANLTDKNRHFMSYILLGCHYVIVHVLSHCHPEDDLSYL